MLSHRFFSCILLASVIFSSCSKEKSYERPGVPLGDLLVKVEAVSDSDTLTTEFAYDDQKRLVSETENGKWGGDQYHRFKKIVWDANANRIAQVLQYEAGSGIAYTDTVRRLVHYPDASTLNYDYIITHTQLWDEQAIDSSAFGYNNEQMLVHHSYLSIPSFALYNKYLSRLEFTYDGNGNTSEISYFESVDPVAGTPPELSAVASLTYSSDIDYQWVTDNAAQNYLLSDYPNKNNKYVRQTLMRDVLTSEMYTILTSYVMGPNGKPTSGYTTLEPDNITVRLKFFYR